MQERPLSSEERLILALGGEIEPEVEIPQTSILDVEILFPPSFPEDEIVTAMSYFQDDSTQVKGITSKKIVVLEALVAGEARDLYERSTGFGFTVNERPRNFSTPDVQSSVVIGVGLAASAFGAGYFGEVGKDSWRATKLVAKKGYSVLRSGIGRLFNREGKYPKIEFKINEGMKIVVENKGNDKEYLRNLGLAETEQLRLKKKLSTRKQKTKTS